MGFRYNISIFLLHVFDMIASVGRFELDKIDIIEYWLMSKPAPDKSKRGSRESVTSAVPHHTQNLKYRYRTQSITPCLLCLLQAITTVSITFPKHH